MKLKLLLPVFVTLFLASCGLKPIAPEHQLIHVDNKNISLSDLGNGEVLIYNDANIFHTADNTSRLNIILDEKNLGQLHAKKYAIVKIEEGKHFFNIKHLDVVSMKSDHVVDVTNSVKVIRVKPTMTSNKLEIVNELPDNWDKYSYMNSK